MNRSRLARLGAALYASAIVALALPNAAAAQTSGANPPAGVRAPAPVQLPRTGNPEADTSGGANLPFVLIGGGALLGILAYRGRRFHHLLHRRRQ